VGRPAELVRMASAFFIEQLLLHPEADSYRVLGADRSATASELRRNMALLLRWLHPDVDRRGARSMFAGRVTGAWETLKTPERRAAYDKDRSTREATPRPRRGKSVRPRGRDEAAGRRFGWREPRRSLLQRALALLFGRARYR
jgi:curved DNA-binding protein CbpA